MLLRSLLPATCAIAAWGVPIARADEFKPPPLSYVHIFTASDGTSRAATEQWPAAAIPSRSFAGALAQYFGGKATKVFIISIKPGIRTPRHNSAGKREFSVILQGSATITLSDGRTRQVAAGDVILIEDKTGPGASISFGPDGYVALTALLAP